MLRVAGVVSLTLFAFGFSQSALAHCEPAEGFSVVTDDDTPDCVVIDTRAGRNNRTFFRNHCDGELSLVVSDEYGGDPVSSEDDAGLPALRVSPGSLSSVVTGPSGRTVDWRLEDGRSGTVYLGWSYTSCGCETMATGTDPLTNMGFFIAFGAAMLRRRATQGAGE